MTREEYNSKVYVGKHEQHEYRVWRVYGPGGPEETITVKGKEALKEAVYGMWDTDVIDLTTGEEMPHL